MLRYAHMRIASAVRGMLFDMMRALASEACRLIRDAATITLFDERLRHAAAFAPLLLSRHAL